MESNVTQLPINKYQQGILDEEWDIDYDKPLSIDFISAIYPAKNRRDGSKVMIMLIDRPLSESLLDQLVGLNHENITKVLGYRKNETTKTRETQKNSLVLFIEYLDGYQSISEMLSGGYKFSEDQIRMIAHYLVYALAYLHKYHIIHRDIKTSNILIHIGNCGSIGIKLGGFELSKYYGNNESSYFTTVGTPIYAAPELFTQNSKDTFSDIWSLGCTLIEVAGGNLLNRYNGLPTIPSNLSNQLRNFIQHCLIVDPYSRPKATELIHHEFIQIDGSVLNNEVYINSKVINNSIELNNQQLNDITITIASNITHVVLPEFNDQDLSIVFNKLPSTVTHLSLPVFNQMIKAHSIPSSIQSLSIPSFNQEIEDYAFPPTLTELEFGQVFQLNENGGMLPYTIKKLKCSYNFDKPLRKNNNIPNSVSILILDNYNQPITKFSIPSTVYSLTLGSNFQEKDLASLSNLPPSVFNLTFGVSKECTLTNGRIKQLIPPQVTKLIVRHPQSTEKLHNPIEWSIDYSNPLGEGAFGKVYKGIKLNGIINNQKIPNGGQCAIKIVSLDSVNKNEIYTLDKLEEWENNNIINIYGYAYGYGSRRTNGLETELLYIYMEYLDGYDTISNYLKKRRLSESQIARVVNDLVYALADLHLVGWISHRDFKGDNLLYNNQTGNIKIIDFGISKTSAPNQFKTQSNVGTRDYTAPELIGNKDATLDRTDIWSLGCTIIEMAGGSLEKSNGFPSIPGHLSNSGRNFIQQCLIYDPKYRPTALQLTLHEFLSGIELSWHQNMLKRMAVKQLIVSKKIHISSSMLKETPLIEESISILELLEYNKVDYEDDFIKLPTSITSLILPIFNQTIKKNSIPSSIQSLSIPSFNHEIEDDSIPPTLTELEFGQVFEFNENGGMLPDTIKKLTCSYNFDRPLKRHNNIPRSVSILILDNYNQPITKFSIPSTVYSLTLGSNFQEKDLASLSNLPPSVFNLTFGVSNECTLTDDQIKQIVPPQVTNLIISRNHNE